MSHLHKFCLRGLAGTGSGQLTVALSCLAPTGSAIWLFFFFFFPGASALVFVKPAFCGHGLEIVVQEKGSRLSSVQVWVCSWEQTSELWWVTFWNFQTLAFPISPAPSLSFSVLFLAAGFKCQTKHRFLSVGSYSPLQGRCPRKSVSGDSLGTDHPASPISTLLGSA